MTGVVKNIAIKFFIWFFLLLVSLVIWFICNFIIPSLPITISYCRGSMAKNMFFLSVLSFMFSAICTSMYLYVYKMIYTKTYSVMSILAILMNVICYTIIAITYSSLENSQSIPFFNTNYQRFLLWAVPIIIIAITWISWSHLDEVSKLFKLNYDQSKVKEIKNDVSNFKL